jgi:hypothetical protein
MMSNQGVVAKVQYCTVPGSKGAREHGRRNHWVAGTQAHGCHGITGALEHGSHEGFGFRV